ncbi:hypothetical protein Tco_0857402 [Tanacetum coccineum]|uniref:Reverse transcriptase domain-containing protein n=1 Tax=Tanacetum coccineum TaxID=301880 RepID=A0ABQ5B6I6_9ASTR
MGRLDKAFQERPLGVLPSDTETYPREERKAVTTMSGLTLDGSFIPHSNFLVYQDEELEPETITEVVEIASSQSTPLVPPPETPPLSTPKPKEDLEPNPHQPPIPCETDTLLSHFYNSPPEYETFSFDIEENSSGSTTTHSDYPLPDYEAFYFDDNHIEEKSSGSTTTHSDFSLPEYDSFIFDLSIDPFPPADRREFTSVVEKNIFDLSSTKDSTSIELNDFPLLLSDCDSSLSKEFSEIDLLVSFPSGNEDIVFDPGIFIIKGVQSERFHILPLDNFPTISFVSDSLLLTDSSEIETFLSFPSENEDKCDRLIGIGFVLDFVEFISFTFGDKEMILMIEKEMILVIEAVSR